MYDIEIVIPVTPKGKYGQRIVDLKKIGILNTGNKKVLLSLLIGPEIGPIINQLSDGWPENITINIVISSNTQETAKIYEYFSQIPKECATRSRWIAKFDDDSVTDVSGLVDKLDEEYDYSKEYYVVTELKREQHKYEDDILREIGFDRWFNPTNIIWHEWEGCVISQATLNRILQSEKSIHLMKKRSQTQKGYSDYCLACAARICKIYPAESYFMSFHPNIGYFSLFGGHVCHIHNMSHDKNPYTIDIFKKMIEKNVGSGEIYNNIVNQEFAYDNGRELYIVRLKDNGIVEEQENRKIIWHINGNGNLEFLQFNGSLISIFDNYENANSLRSKTSTLRKLA